MNPASDYLALTLRWALTVLCALCALALGLTAIVLAGLDAYDWLKDGSTDLTPLSALTGPIRRIGVQAVLDSVPVWLCMFLAAGGFMWLWKQLRLKTHTGHYLMRQRHRHAARKLRRDWGRKDPGRDQV